MTDVCVFFGFFPEMTGNDRSGLDFFRVHNERRETKEGGAGRWLEKGARRATSWQR
jgi:hypothetical protein